MDPPHTSSAEGEYSPFISLLGQIHHICIMKANQAHVQDNGTFLVN